MTDLVLRNVEIDGRGGLDLAIEAGRITAIGPRLAVRGDDEVEGGGAALLPGLNDHHLHLFALAAARQSVVLADLTGHDALAQALAAADARLPVGAWLRGAGYHDGVAGSLDRHVLDALVPTRPARIQYATGSLWVFNSLALVQLAGGGWPEGLERDKAGQPTGRVFREDRWLRERLPSTPPALDQVAADLDRYGITGVTDASATTDDASARTLVERARAAGFRQHLQLMSRGPLAAPADSAFTVGAVKVLLDDHRLGDLAHMTDAIAMARAAGRAVAVHCVTAGELAYALAAWDIGGVRPGDRVEHGGVIDPEAAAAIAARGLTVVTQPVFIAERGDRYLAEVDPADQDFLYPCASLQRLGVKVAGSSDAPYGGLDPWAAMRTAVNRRTRAGWSVGLDERVSAQDALALYLGSPDAPARIRRIDVGTVADLCLMRGPGATILRELSSELVRETIVAGVRPRVRNCDGAG